MAKVGVHRRADTAAHVGQEGTLGAVGGLGQVAGLHQPEVGDLQLRGALLHPLLKFDIELVQRRLGLLAVAGVAGQCKQQRPLSQCHRITADLDGQQRAVGAPQPGLRQALRRLCHALVQRPQQAARRRVGVPLLQVYADHRCTRLAQHAGKGVVGLDQGAVGIEEVDAVAGAAQQGPAALVRLALLANRAPLWTCCSGTLADATPPKPPSDRLRRRANATSQTQVTRPRIALLIYGPVSGRSSSVGD